MAFIELPLAALSFWVAVRSSRARSGHVTDRTDGSSVLL
jgi:hypothetical protein